MVLALSGLIAYLYWQNTRILQQLQQLALVVASHLNEQQPLPKQEPVPEPAPEPVPEPEAEEEEEEEEEEEVDDRVEVVEGPPAVDVDDLHSKTVKELHEILTKKGIPFGKRDAKPVLIQLLKATA